MKKVIALLLIVVIVFSFASCKPKEEGPEPVTGVPFDKEVLAEKWKNGSLTFPNGNQVTLPCTATEFAEKSGYSIPTLNALAETVLEAGAKYPNTVKLTGPDFYVTILLKNTTEEAVTLPNATVVGYVLTVSDDANHQVKFAETLTVLAERTAVEEVLGVDEDATGNVSYYSGRNKQGKRVEMRVRYNSDNLVNYVAYEIL